MGRRVPFLKFVDVYKNRIQDNVMESNKESFLIRKFNNAKSASGK